jgi:predicted GNAT family N-acyltransferase
MKILPAELSDAPEISRFVSEITSTHIGPTLGAGGLEKLLASMDVESTTKRMTEGYSHWVAVDGGALIGVVVVQPPSHLYHLFVHSDRQRSGVGRALFHEALRFISNSTGCTTVTVNSSLNAVDVYRRFGFSPAGDFREKDGIRSVPMQLDLPD